MTMKRKQAKWSKEDREKASGYLASAREALTRIESELIRQWAKEDDGWVKVVKVTRREPYKHRVWQHE